MGLSTQCGSALKHSIQNKQPLRCKWLTLVWASGTVRHNPIYICTYAWLCARVQVISTIQVHTDITYTYFSEPFCDLLSRSPFQPTECLRHGFRDGHCGLHGRHGVGRGCHRAWDDQGRSISHGSSADWGMVGLWHCYTWLGDISMWMGLIILYHGIYYGDYISRFIMIGDIYIYDISM